MKVCIYSGVIQTTTFIERLILGLANEGTDIVIIGKTNGGSFPVHPRVQVVTIERGLKGDWQFLLRFIKGFFVQKNRVLTFKQHIGQWPWQSRSTWKTWQNQLPIILNKPDVFHLQWAASISNYIYLKDLFDVKFVLSLRGAHINYSPICDPKIAVQYREHFPKIDAFHAVSKAIAKEASLYGADPKKIKVVYSGLQLHDFPFNTQKTANASGVIKIISVGREHWKKGYRYAVDAIAALVNKGYAVEYTIVGGMTTELRHHIHQLNLEHCIHLKNRVPFQEVKQAIAEAHMLLLPSVEEGIANVVLEAMALGTLVVSSDCGGMQEAIQHEQSGFIFPLRNTELMVKCMEDAMALSPNEYQNLTTKARAYVEQHHHLDNLVSGMLGLYRNIQ